MKRWEDLTLAEQAALDVLETSKKLGTLAEPSTRSTDERPHWIRVHSRTARRLEELGLARSKCVLPDDREVKGRDLVHLLGHWKKKYEITPAGLRVLGQRRR